MRALRNPNYAIYTAGNCVSQIGTWMQRIGVGWLTWELTGSGTWLGLMAFADLFPAVVVGPIAGAAADRWDRLKVTQISQGLGLVQAALLALLYAMGLLTVELLLAFTFFYGCVHAFNQPARLAMINSLVHREELTSAVAINSLGLNVARLVGPGIAGVMIASIGLFWVFATNALSFAVFVATLFVVKTTQEGEIKPRGNLLAEAWDGVRHAVRNRNIFALLLLTTLISICAKPVIELLPAFADVVYRAGPMGLATLTASMAVGGIIGGLWLSMRPSREGLARYVFVGSLGSALAVGAFAFVQNLWLGAALLVGGGGFIIIGSIATQTLIQLTVENHLRGRMLSLHGIIQRGAPAIGALVMGSASDFVGLSWPVAAACLILLASWLWFLPRMKTVTEALDRLAGMGTKP
jgi:MFS family permease